MASMFLRRPPLFMPALYIQLCQIRHARGGMLTSGVRISGVRDHNSVIFAALGF